MLDKFIEGELVDLCIPTMEFARDSEWYSWFNSPKITKYLPELGGFPNTKSDQEKFFAQNKDKRLILIIFNKFNIAKGVISLSAIDFKRRSCHIAMATDNSIDTLLSPYQCLESMALIAEHAFTKLGMYRIFAGSHEMLKGWRTLMELIGYKIEGIHIDKYVNGNEIKNEVSLALLFKDFQKLAESRGGHLWDSFESMKIRLKQIPSEKYEDKLFKLLNEFGIDYYNKIFSL